MAVGTADVGRSSRSVTIPTRHFTGTMPGINVQIGIRTHAYPKAGLRGNTENDGEL